MLSVRFINQITEWPAGQAPFPTSIVINVLAINLQVGFRYGLKLSSGVWYIMAQDYICCVSNEEIIDGAVHICEIPCACGK